MTRWRLLWLLIVLAMMTVIVNGALDLATNAAANVPHWPWGLETVHEHPFRWLAGLLGLMAVLGGLATWLGDRLIFRLRRAYEKAPPPDGIVPRRHEVERAYNGLRRGHTVVITAAHGAGGVGKTTIADLVRTNPRVQRRYRDRVYMFTLGRDARTKAAIARKLNEVISVLAPDQPGTFTDPKSAGERLQDLLQKPPRKLLILDDVWTEDQLKPFGASGQHCSLLVTTRIPGLADSRALHIDVDLMSADQARTLLLRKLPPLPEPLVRGLLDETGRWPLLLHLVNKALNRQIYGGLADPVVIAEEIRDRLRTSGALEIDKYTGEVQLDMDDPDKRRLAVRATIGASTNLLEQHEQRLFAELAAFAENEPVPIGLVLRLWQATTGLDAPTARELCARLRDLALVQLPDPPGRDATVVLHDVIRDYLDRELGEQRPAVHGALLDAVATTLPSALPLPGAGQRVAVAWWELVERDPYLREHLVEHFVAAGRVQDAEEVAGDLRWVGARLARSGPAAPYADLARVGTSTTERMRTLLGQNAHLLGPTEPRSAQLAVLYSRVAHDPTWGPQGQALADEDSQPRLVNRWPLPDLPDPSLRRTLTGHTGPVRSLAIDPHGDWIASTGSDDRTIRIWDVATGQQRPELTGHADTVRAVAAAPDGSWLVSVGADAAVRRWHVETGRQVDSFTGHAGWLFAVVVAPDASWVAAGGHDGSIHVWDVATRRRRAVLSGHTGSIRTLAVAVDGGLIASGASDDLAVRIWDTRTWEACAELTGHTGSVLAVAFAADGWLVSAGHDRSVRIWEAGTWRELAALTGHTAPVRAVAVAPDGTWVASAGEDESVRIWDVATRRERARLTGRTGWMLAVAAAPDGTWLASGSSDHTVQIWEGTAASPGTVQTARTSVVKSVAVCPDGTWIASAGADRLVHLWDTDSGRERATLIGHTGAVNAVAVGPRGDWVASAGQDRTVRIWDVATARQRAGLTGHTGAIQALAIAPDGTWLASAGDETVRIWSMDGPGRVAELTGHSGPVYAVAIAPDGTWLASGGDDGTVRIWQPGNGVQRESLTVRTGAVHALAISPDGTWLACGDQDGTISIWHRANWNWRRGPVLRGHSRSVDALAISPDGRWLASVGHDGTIRIWNPADGTLVTMMRCAGGGNSCAWTPDSTAVTVGCPTGVSLFGFRGPRPRVPAPRKPPSATQSARST